MTEQTNVLDTLATGLCFGEGPRWHDDRLWFSDMHAHRVLTLADDGSLNTVVEVPNRPSGLGWLPNGELLIVSMTDRLILRFDGQTLKPHADLSGLTRFSCNDMVVDASGRAYVGNFGFDLENGATPAATELICVEPNGEARVVAEDLMFPNGAVISADGATLIVAETFAARLSAFVIEANGDLGARRTWAQLPQGAVPDGICLDRDGGIWSASPSTNECLRQLEGGEITHRVAVDQSAIACMLGGAAGDTLYILTASSTNHEECRALKAGRLQAWQAPYPRTGWP